MTGIDRTQNGLMRLFCELTEMSSEDNFELGIANYNKYFHQYTISFSNPQPIKMTEGNTTQLDTVVKDNGSTVTPIPPITYTTLDETIATVNEKGEVTAIGEGTVMVTAKLTNNSEATASIEIQVAKATPEPTGYSITLFYGKSPTIRIGGFGTTITATVSANGETISDKPVDWSARNEDGSETPKVQFLDVTDTSCRMQGLDDMDSVGTFVIVKATLREDSTIFAEQSFQLRSLF
ncbi:MAG: Ig-like domain-containing protein [Epulopiscium sp.]|nr:Ig-like domain-containing protein [Candidatus Epulonipiscium sp.]